jgi:hypothetical protein
VRFVAVDSYPLCESYDSFEGAIAGALNAPLQSKAKADTERLLGSQVADACWTDTECVIRFSNGIFLHISVEAETLSWQLADVQPTLSDTVESIGAPAVTLRWPAQADYVMDRSALAANRVACEFIRLFTTNGALLICCRGRLIWWFTAIRRLDTGKSFLFVTEED